MDLQQILCSQSISEIYQKQLLPKGGADPKPNSKVDGKLQKH